MALTAFNEDMEIISKLSDLPNDTDGLTAAKIAAGAVTAEKLAAGAVTNTKLATGSVTNEKTDFSAGFAPAGPIRLIKGVHYFGSEAELPAATDEGRVYFVEVS